MNNTHESTKEIVLKVSNLTKAYGEVKPINQMSFEVYKNDAIAIIGPSGTGKSTLLRMINMLNTPTSGQIFLGDEEVTKEGYPLNKLRLKVGMVFQSYTLFSHMTVIENCMDAQIKLLKRSRQEAYARAYDELNKVHMTDHILKYPDQLSGGQKQRVAIARALAMDPEILLLDEPTSALDPTMVSEVETVIKSPLKRGITMLIVTHEMRLARAASNRVFFLTGGSIYEEGSPEKIFDNPEREATKNFVKRIKKKEWLIKNKDFDFLTSISEIDSFCRDADISIKTNKAIQSIFEETVTQIMLPQIKGQPLIKFTLEYSGQSQLLRLMIEYAGPKLRITDTDNEMAKDLLLHYSDIIEVEPTSDDLNDGFNNAFELKLKKSL